MRGRGQLRYNCASRGLGIHLLLQRLSTLFIAWSFALRGIDIVSGGPGSLRLRLEVECL